MRIRDSFTQLALFLCIVFQFTAGAEYDIRQIADETRINRDPVISGTGLVAWQSLSGEGTDNAESEVVIYQNGTVKPLTEGSALVAGNLNPRVHGSRAVWTAGSKRAEYVAPQPRVPAGTNAVPADTETAAAAAPEEPAPKKEVKPGRGGDNIVFWDGSEVKVLTNDGRDNAHPSLSDTTIAWQTDRQWPLGWEIMVWNNGEATQVTSNEFYDMAPQVSGNRVVWYGWDGEDYEIFLYDHDTRETTQITDNRYDDIAPVITEDMIAWQGFPSVESDIFVWQDGAIKKLSDNPEDDSHVRASGKLVVWQGFDGDDFEIYLYDGEKVVQLTNNKFDDVEPDVGDGAVCWMGYHNNWDPEIFVLPSIDGVAEMLTSNDYEDRDPKTAGRKVTWRARNEGRTMVYLAEPKE
ncbi:MAG TPA: hypothetical protein PKK36_02330 [Kiritimatiellia bacterium]|nr:hypothetical protein [Kiritimatiellia bacterium]